MVLGQRTTKETNQEKVYKSLDQGLVKQTLKTSSSAGAAGKAWGLALDVEMNWHRGTGTLRLNTGRNNRAPVKQIRSGLGIMKAGNKCIWNERTVSVSLQNKTGYAPRNNNAVNAELKLQRGIWRCCLCDISIDIFNCCCPLLLINTIQSAC